MKYQIKRVIPGEEGADPTYEDVEVSRKSQRLR